jgi:general stress protein 26
MSEATIEQIWKMMEDIRFSMVTNRTLTGMQSRPLTAQIDTEFQKINFIVPITSEICSQLQENTELHLIFIDLKAQNYISVSATASILQDSGLAKRLWNSFAQAWFPKGPDDPDIRIIQASPAMIEYWAGESSKLLAAWELGKSLLTKTPPDLGAKIAIKL